MFLLCLLKAVIYTLAMFYFTRNIVKVTRYNEEAIKFNIGQTILYFIVSALPFVGEFIFIVCICILISNFISGIEKKRNHYYEYITIKEGKKNILYNFAKILKTEI